MKTDWASFLHRQLLDLEAAGLRRSLRELTSPPGRVARFGEQWLINFASNDYLGLAAHPALVEAAQRAARDFGAGAGASRLICGSLQPHHELETALAAFKSTEAALTFATGHAAALGAVVAVVGRGDVVILDKLAHACLVDAAKLSGAKLRVFRHNDLNDLERKLRWAADKHPAGRVLVVTESVFSMDGNLAPLRNIVELKERFGAWLFVDEAHATGLFGEHRRGLVEEFGLAGRVEIQMTTLGKAVGAAGGAICGSRDLIELLINRARPFLFSTAPVPAAAAAARAGLEILRTAEGEQRRQRLWQVVESLKTTLIESGFPPSVVRAPIIPVRIGPEAEAVALADALRAAGVLVPAIRYPTVARRQARLRVTASADHTGEDLAALRAALSAAREKLEPPGHA